MGHLKESVNSYLHAVKIQPQNYDVWYTLAETYIELSDWLNALDAFDQCLKIKPNDANSVYGKAKINFILSRTEEAIKCLKIAFELDPGIQKEFAREYPEVKSSRLFKKLLGEN